MPGMVRSVWMSAASSGALALMTMSTVAHAQGAWTDARLAPDARANAVLKAMTLDEELSLLTTSFPMLAQMKRTADAKMPEGVPMSAGYLRPVPRLHLPAVAETDASLGVSNTGAMRKNDVATALPAGLALGASFDPELAYRGGQMIGREARAKGFGIMLAGGVNLVREPRGGRAFEYLSEDPLVSGLLGGKAIAGVQSNHIISTVKHYALNATEIGRFGYNVDMAESAMRESDLLAFQIAHEIGQPGSVMCAYNKVNTAYACENPFLLTKVLKQDWGFKGYVMSDWGAVHSTGALLAGLDQESGHEADTSPFFATDLKQALSDGKIARSAVDDAARRVLRSLFAHGLYDNPPAQGGAIDYAAHAEVAQAQAEAGIVLLRNEKGALPIAATARHIAVIGGHADVGVLFGGGSAQVIPVGGAKLTIKPKGVSALAFGERTYGGTSPVEAIKKQFPDAVVDFVDGQDPAAAAALAKSADIAIVFGEKWAAEGDDMADLSLGAGQDELISAVADANARTVVVLETGNPVLMPWHDKTAAILEAWFPGQRGAEAIARVLSGVVNPSGHLPITFPASVEQLPNPKAPGVGVPEVKKEIGPGFPTIIDKAPFTYTFPEGADVGYRWYAKTAAKPLYPFGLGLSYTSFETSGLVVRGDAATFTLRNTGTREGATLGQLYLLSRGGQASRRLVAFKRVVLKPGERQSVTVKIDRRLLADWKKGGWETPAGIYAFALGDDAETLKTPVTVHFSLQHWVQ